MKARVKATGEIVEIVGEGIQNSNMVIAAHGEWFTKDELSMLCMATGIIPKDATCRTCKHRERFELNYHSNKIVQCCVKQPSKRSNSGYKTIKVTDRACFRYEKEERK